MNESDYRHKEFFDCDCYSKDDLIRAEYSISDYRKDEFIYRELIIIFETYLADYDYDLRSKFFKRVAWRIKHAFKILFTGIIKTEGFFIPCRSSIDINSDPIEGVFGYKTTKDFAKWLDETADIIKKDYEKDEKDKKYG